MTTIAAKQSKYNYIVLFISVVVYKVLLDVSYVYMQPSHAYMGFNFITTELFPRLAISYLLAIFIFHVMPKEIEKPSDLFIYIQYLIICLPLYTYYAMNNVEIGYIIMVSIVHIFEILIIISFKPKQFLILNKHMLLGTYFYMLILLLLLFTVVISLSSYGMPNFMALNIYNVYKIRGSMTVLFPLTYTVSWCAKIIIPFMICKYMRSKKYVFMLFFILLELYFYLTYAHKIFLLMPFAIISATYIFRKKNSSILLSFASTMLVGISMLLFVTEVNVNVMDLFVRRGLFTETLLQYDYYHFFSTHSFVYFADGLIGKIFGNVSPYKYTIPFQIAQYYYARSFSANSGYIADAFANAGYLGVGIICVIWSILLRLLNMLYAQVKDKDIVLSLLFFPFMMFAETSFLTNLLTGGFLIVYTLIVLQACFEKKK